MAKIVGFVLGCVVLFEIILGVPILSTWFGNWSVRMSLAWLIALFAFGWPVSRQAPVFYALLAIMGLSLVFSYEFYEQVGNIAFTVLMGMLVSDFWQAWSR